MLKKLMLFCCMAVFTAMAVELPERIISGYGGHIFGSRDAQVEGGHIWRMMELMKQHKFNSIEIKFQQVLPNGVRKMQLDRYKGDVAKFYQKATECGLMLQIYLYPCPDARRRPEWEEHARCQAVVAADGLELPGVFALNDVNSWRTLFEHAYQFARLHKEIPFTSLKFDMELTSLYYSYDDGTWGRFCAANPQFAADTPAANRAQLLKDKNAEALYKAFFEKEVEAAAKTFADELHAIAPTLILGYMPSHHGALARIMETVLATDTLPAIVDGWELYNGAGIEDYIVQRAALAKQRHPNNRYVSWLRPDNYSAEDLAIQAYHAGAKLDGYSIWVLWMLDAAYPQRIPKGIASVDAHWAAFGRANEALRADIAAGTLNNPVRIPFKKAQSKVASIDYSDLVIPTLRPVGNGDMAGSVRRYLLREQQVILFYARAGEKLDIRIHHMGDNRRPTGLQYAVMDQQKNILRNESLTFGTTSHFQVDAPHTGTQDHRISSGIGGQAWNSVEIKTPYAAIYQAPRTRIYLFGPQKVFVAGAALGNRQLNFATTAAESWKLSLDGAAAQVYRRPGNINLPLADKAAVAVDFQKGGIDYSQNIFLTFPGGRTPLVFFGPERTMEIVR